jgi:hypothetical protein
MNYEDAHCQFPLFSATTIPATTTAAATGGSRTTKIAAAAATTTAIGGNGTAIQGKRDYMRAM